MGPLRVRVLGGLAVEGVPARALGSRKQRRLLSRLVLADGAVVSYDDLTDDLWGDQQPASPRDDLSVLVSRLRSALPEGSLTRRDAGYAVALEWSDLRALSRNRDQASSRASDEDWPGAVSAARAALELVHGLVLPEFADAAWVMTEQHVVDRTVQSVRFVLARAELAAGDPRIAIDTTREILATSPYDEVALRLHLEACLAALSPALGLATYAAARERLRLDLDVDPAHETVAMHTRLLRATRHDHLAPSKAAGEQVQTRYAKTADGLHIAYQVTGTGPVDVLFNVGLLSHVEATWQFPGKAEFYREIASFSRLIRFDKRGSGLSDPVSGPVTLEDRTEDMRAVLNAVGSDRAVLLGISEGGAMSTMFAAVHPERTTALVLYGTGARTCRAQGYPWGDERADREAVIDLITAGWGTPGGLALRLLAPSLAGNAEALEAFARFERLASSPGQFAVTQRMNMDLDVRAVLPAVSAPTLVLHRDREQLFALGHAHYLADHIAGAKLVVLPGQDHMFWVQPQQITVEIERFVRAQQAGSVPDRLLSTVVSADVVTGNENRRRLMELVEGALQQFSGKLLAESGERLIMGFDGPARAVRCAHSLSSRARDLDLELRAGVHAGAVPARVYDAGSSTVRAAARLSALAEADDVLVSGAVRDLVAGSGITFREHGTHVLEEEAGTWPVLRVDAV